MSQSNHSQEQWKVVLRSPGGVERDFCGGFPSEKAAEDFAAEHGWRHVDENRFEWSLDVKQDDGPIRCRKHGRSHGRKANVER